MDSGEVALAEVLALRSLLLNLHFRSATIPEAEMRAYGIGLGVTRHPRMVAVEQLQVAVREPQWNQAAKGKTGLAGSCTATLKLPKGNHNKTRPLSVRGRIPSAPSSVKALRPLRGALKDARP